MYKKILFPFSPGRSFNSGYTWAIELAVRMNAALMTFTTVPAGEKNNAEFLRRVDHSLREAQGNYLQYSGQGLSTAPMERHIMQGDFTWSLSKFVRKNKFDIVVIDPQASGLPENTLNELVENSNGVIVLPQDQNDLGIGGTTAGLEAEKITEAFYDVLNQSDLYKIQDNFFRTLGRDKKLFNYLRSFFRRNLHRES